MRYLQTRKTKISLEQKFSDLFIIFGCISGRGKSITNVHKFNNLQSHLIALYFAISEQIFTQLKEAHIPKLPQDAGFSWN